MITRYTVTHPDWMKHAVPSLKRSLKLYESGSLPAAIEAWMLTVPIRHVLRSIYGNNFTAAMILLWMALTELPGKAWDWLCMSWRYKVLLRSPERDREEMIAHLEAEERREREGER